MGTKPMLRPEPIHEVQPQTLGLTYAQRAILRRGHPRYIITDLVGGIWTFYFLWTHNWLWAIATLYMSAVVGTVVTAKVNLRKLATTKLGKIMLLHLHPANFVTQLVGVGVLAYGVWMHFPEIILAGVSLILLGHLRGWHNIHDAL
ncbi:MAG TPA: hypothetical protein VJR04_14250 [Terriglobales bacterium]|nr:hypothetical protein [Terriglobales bacterium]